MVFFVFIELKNRSGGNKLADVFSEPSEIHKIEFFVKILNAWKAWTTFTKSSVRCTEKLMHALWTLHQNKCGFDKAIDIIDSIPPQRYVIAISLPTGSVLSHLNSFPVSHLIWACFNWSEIKAVQSKTKVKVFFPIVQNTTKVLTPPPLSCFYKDYEQIPKKIKIFQHLLKNF